MTGASGKGGAKAGRRARPQDARQAHAQVLALLAALAEPPAERPLREAREGAGYRSRAAFKLVEMDDKARFLKAGQRLVDLGCAPGGWAQVAAERIGLKQGKGRIVGIDLLHIDPIPGVELLQMDFMADDAPARLKDLLGGPADGVMSDMAANTTGHKKTDHLRIIGLAEAAVEFAREVLAPGGFFLCKLFQGGDSAGLLTQLKRDFALVRNVKPPASRADSSELYVLATGFRGSGKPAS